MPDEQLRVERSYGATSNQVSANSCWLLAARCSAPQAQKIAHLTPPSVRPALAEPHAALLTGGFWGGGGRRKRRLPKKTHPTRRCSANKS
jgi:hypothetical protein